MEQSDMFGDNDLFITEEVKVSDRLRKLAEQAVELNKKIVASEDATKKLKEALNAITQKFLVDEMITQGSTEITLEDHTKFKLSTFVSGSLPKDENAKETAIDWLMAHGADGLVKSEVTTIFPCKQVEAAFSLRDELAERGLIADVKTSVNPMTLQAWAKEALRNGVEDLPLETLGLTTGQFVKVTWPKEKL